MRIALNAFTLQLRTKNRKVKPLTRGHGPSHSVTAVSAELGVLIAGGLRAVEKRGQASGPGPGAETQPYLFRTVSLNLFAYPCPHG